MKTTVDVQWIDNLAFEADIQGHKIILEATNENGGLSKGPSPKPLILASLGGCTGMDVVSILKKMNINFETFNVKIEGIIAEDHPKKYNEINIIYEIKGKDLPFEKVEKAVNLSIEKYCGVYSTLVNSVKMSHEIKILNIE
jgi:putative redox protein